MKKFDKERVLLAVAGPVIALAVAFVLSAIVLIASGKNPVEPFALMFEQAGYSDVQVLILNQASMYYIAALAVAIGFRMNLFNIGVDGQYQLGAMMAAIVGAHANLPAFLQVPLLLLTAVCTGAFWAGIARRPQGHPRGQRGRRHDHAQRDRHLADRLHVEAGRLRRQDRQQQHHRRDARVRLDPGHRPRPVR